ncbi:MAG: GNAT family N-acetyltransferase [Clostridiales bacterium]|nr:GNAT family N-acetyltransferase [Clostridiales bacterium]
MIIQAEQQHTALIVPLMAAFRRELRALKGAQTGEDLACAREEFLDCLGRGWTMYCYLAEGVALGYALCRVEGGIVWCEHLYVQPDHRRQGIASALFRQAEALAASLGESMVYNWVHPNNQAIIAFLKKQGYDVLNLIELRKAQPDEQLIPGFVVGENSYKYWLAGRPMA